MPPFVGTGIKTPELEKMAKRGLTMTNFHAAAPICSPSRASIVTGLFSWRVGIAGVYEYGKKDGRTNRNDWMNHMPTSAMAFRDAGYYTAHVGKWHLGGMRQTDVDERLQHKQCSHPGPNQHGFTEYVSMTEGPDDPRQGPVMQRGAMLHTMGGKNLLRNDAPHPCHLNSLSNCEAQEAIRIMKQTKDNNMSFYMHVWFEQPHGPWNLMPGFTDWYGGPRLNRGSRMDCFKTMVSAMDESVGRILKALHDLDLEEDTIVLFTSDNGPEINAGTTAGFKNRKRFLHEGGLRVPAIWQWPGHIEPGIKIADFGVGVDIYPTFLEAAGVKKPEHVKLDGLSLLPYVAPTSSRDRRKKNKVASAQSGRVLAARPSPFHTTPHRTVDTNPRAQQTKVTQPGRSSVRAAKPVPGQNKPHARFKAGNFTGQFGFFSADNVLRGDLPLKYEGIDLVSRMWELENRIAMWYVEFEHPRNAALISHNFKIISGPEHLPIEIYDLLSDPFEKVNLIRATDFEYWNQQMNKNMSTSKKKLFVELNGTDTNGKIDKLLNAVVPTLYYFSKYGNAANLLYLKKNYGMSIWPNPVNFDTVKLTNRELIGKCAVPASADVPSLPFEHADHKVHQVVRPMDYYHD